MVVFFKCEYQVFIEKTDCGTISPWYICTHFFIFLMADVNGNVVK